MNPLSSDMLGLMAPAFFTGIIIAAVHVPLGQEVLRRGIIFIDLAIAQIAALGVVSAKVLFHLEQGLGPFLFALAFAWAASGIFAGLERKAPKYQEAFIGCTFVIAASVILIMLASDPHGGEEVEGLLAGQILWVSWQQAGIAAALYSIVLFLWFRWPMRRQALFYGLFPVVVTMSVQLVGVYLVFASLIMPALGAINFSAKSRLVAGYGIAFVAVTAGLMVSVLADLPAGPALVCLFAASGLVCSCFAKNFADERSVH